MKTARNGRTPKGKKQTDTKKAATVAAAVSAILCCLCLSFIAFDSEKYQNDSVLASITYTEPEKPEEKGFWELFSEAVVYIFMPEN